MPDPQLFPVEEIKDAFHACVDTVPQYVFQYGTLRYRGEHIPSLKSLDVDGRVLYSHSFSKILSPGFRTSILCGHKEIIRNIVVSKQYSDICTNTLSQYILLHLLLEKRIDAIIQHNCKAYSEKRDVMLHEIGENFPGEVSWTEPDGGFFVFVRFPDWMDTRLLYREALENNLAFVPGKPFFEGDEGYNYLRLSFSQVSRETIRDGIRQLGDLVRTRLDQHSNMSNSA